MPMMAHKQHGFMSVNSDISEMLKAGWVVCDDVMKFKREVMGIGVQAPVVQEEKPDTIEEQPKVRRAGRPRKEVPSILNDGGDDGNSTDDN